MKVFISWSGNRSKKLADIFRRWLPGVLQAIRPYFSPDDVAKGSRWNSEIAKELEASKVGLIFLTRENLNANWLMFEAGALSKNLARSHVCPILFGIEPTDIEGPLVQFQAARFDKTEVMRVVKMMNSGLDSESLTEEVLDNVFKMWWPKLEDEVKIAMMEDANDASGETRSERDLLEEILSLTRSFGGRGRVDSIHPKAISDLVKGYAEIVHNLKDIGLLEPVSDSCEKIKDAIDHIMRKSTTSLISKNNMQLYREAVYFVESISREPDLLSEDESKKNTPE